MLFSLAITENTKQKFNVGTRLIRAEAVANLVVSGTGAEFDYPMNDRDRRSALTHLTTTETAANIKTAMDGAYATVHIDLLVHPDENASAATVTTTFNAADIVWGAAYPADAANKSYIYIQNGAFKVVRYLVDYTLAEVIALV